VKSDLLTKNAAVDKEESAFLATLKGKNKSTDRVLSFEKGPLAGLVRFEFSALGMGSSVRLLCKTLMTNILVVRGRSTDIRASQGSIQADRYSSVFPQDHCQG